MLGEIMNDCCDVYNIDKKESKAKSPSGIILSQWTKSPSDKIPVALAVIIAVRDVLV